ncbi:MAG TPA: hypothetical protein VGB55_07050 [Tepidisphaeraceae bacterium]|jgi:hypothetical protein
MKLVLLEETQTACIAPGMPGTEDNRYGCEGGLVIKEDGQYHCFTTEVWGSPKLRKTRLAHWHSVDGLNFSRKSTAIAPGQVAAGTVTDAKEPWTPYPIYNEAEGRWNLFYTGYGSPIGSILRAASDVPGRSGISGPWTPIDSPTAPSADKVFRQGNSFFPFRAGGRWMAFFGHNTYSAKTTRDDWRFFVSLASAPSLNGPWEPINQSAPVLMDERFVENPVVHELSPGKFITLYDGETVHGIAYATSSNGVDWNREQVLWLSSPPTPWAWHMRTPLGLVHEKDDIYSLYYTAFDYEEPHPREQPLYHYGFGRLGRVTVRVVD